MPSTQLIAGIVEAANTLGLDLLNPLDSDWMILDDTGSPVIIPDTVPRFEYRGEARVSNYPIEKGAFETYNKVQDPFDIRMMMVCAGLNYAQNIIQSIGLNLGQQNMQRSAFLDTLDYMKQTTDLFTIVTPDKTYENVNMVHFDFRRETTNGATMLLVEAWFEEIRVQASATYTQTASPSAADPVDLGTVHSGDAIAVEFKGPPVPQPVTP